MTRHDALTVALATFGNWTISTVFAPHLWAPMLGVLWAIGITVVGAVNRPWL